MHYCKRQDGAATRLNSEASLNVMISDPFEASSSCRGPASLLTYNCDRFEQSREMKGSHPPTNFLKSTKREIKFLAFLLSTTVACRLFSVLM